MSENRFSLAQILPFAWNNTISHWGLWIVASSLLLIDFIMRAAAIVLMVGVSLQRFISVPLDTLVPMRTALPLEKFSLKMLVLAIVIYIIFDIVGGILRMGATRIALDLYDTGSSNASRITSCANLAIKRFIASLLYLTMFFGGLVLFIIPGIILGIRFLFFEAVMVDTKCGPLTALSKSAELTKGLLTPLLAVLFFVTIIWSLMGSAMLTFFIAMPMTVLTTVWIYRNLGARRAE